MGRALEAVRRKKLEKLFRYFDLEVQPQLVEAHRGAIATRFEAECEAIVREALRLSYTSAIGG